MGRSRDLGRRITPPLLILLVGGALAYWAARQTDRRLDDMRAFVTDLCLSVAGGREPVHLPTVSPLLDERLGEALAAACRPLAEDGRGLDVVMYHGDAPGSPDPDVTAHAMIRVGGVDRLGLRLTDRHDEIEIVGYWYPDPAP